jgi:omega-hydroxy-beta-dihydromenaquinone-9 sulfotransferase
LERLLRLRKKEKKRRGVVLQVVPGLPLGSLYRVLQRNRFQVDPLYIARIGYLMIMGFANTTFGWVEDLFKGRQIEREVLSHDPLFILGHWRSGTTHLHNLLSQDENHSFPTAYQAMFPHHFIVNPRSRFIFDLWAPSTRPMDNVAFSSAVPHEDEFGLAALSTVSPYMRVLFPVSGDNEYACLDPMALPEEAREEFKRAMRLFAKKLHLVNDKKRMVLKSPPHTGRVRILLELFPKAKFVHIVRNPYEVYLSTHKLWATTFRASHLQKPTPELIDELILSWYVELFELFERDRGMIPEGALHEIRYEELERDPRGALAAVYEDLGLPGFDRFWERASRYLESIKDYKKNSYDLESAFRSGSLRERVGNRWKSIFERYGYPL